MLAVLVLALVLTGCSPRNLIAGSKGWSATVEKDGVVYVGTREGKFLALNREDGRELWHYPESDEASIGGVHNPPAIGDELVYVGAYDGNLYAFERDAAPGVVQPVWSIPTRGPIVSGPALADGKVLVGSEDGKLYAFDASTGDTIWTFPVRGNLGKIWSTPVVDEERAYFGSLDHYVYAVSLADGTMAWRYKTGGAIASKPLLVGKRVIVGSFDRTLYALDSSSGEPLWSFSADNWFWASPAYDGATIFASSLDGKVYALDPSSGGLIWDFDAESPIISTPLITDDGLAVASEEGRLHLLYPTFRGEQERWFYDLGAVVRAPLTGSGTTLYLGDTDGAVRRINTTGGNREEWKISTTR